MAERPKPEGAPPSRLRDALRQARIESAERTAVVVDLHDAEIARLELMNEALDPMFAEIPADIEMFDRGISRGEPPRLWIDMIACIVMGRDKRTYRLIQDTRYGPTVLQEAAAPPEMVKAVTSYIARRIIERERALAADDRLGLQFRGSRISRTTFWRGLRNFSIGLFLGLVAITVATLIALSRM